MTSKTTVAIDQAVRKKLKKLAGLLDISQGKVIEQALNMFEEAILMKRVEGYDSVNNESEINVKKILETARKKIWEKDPECKIIQEKLESGPETIDDFIISKWNSGLV
ncbi:MAG: hypothetical protein ACTSRS_07535 [Candidatus Helarchaeota archaeon]